MEEIWTRIDAWLKVNAPKVFNTLQPGASDSQIQAAESILAIQFPEDVKASYRIHNGQQTIYDYGLIPEAQEFLSLERIQAEWAVWKELLNQGQLVGKGEPDPGIKSDWWNLRWIPLTSDYCGNHYCLDLDPAERGNVGQIITMVHDDSYRELLAPSFRSWLENYAAKLESGEYVFSEKYSAFPGIVTLELLQDSDKPRSDPLPVDTVETIVTAKSVTIGIYDGHKKPIERNAPSANKDEVMLSLNGETILQSILLDAIKQSYPIELAPGVNTITLTVVRAKSVPLVMPFVTIDESLIYRGKSEHQFGFMEEVSSASFTISYLPDD
jgi:cell wall assembly regulator SMI1